MKHYDGKQFITDLVSGIIVAIIALPSGVITASYLEELRTERQRQSENNEENKD